MLHSYFYFTMFYSKWWARRVLRAASSEGGRSYTVTEKARLRIYRVLSYPSICWRSVSVNGQWSATWSQDRKTESEEKKGIIWYGLHGGPVSSAPSPLSRPLADEPPLPSLASLPLRHKEAQSHRSLMLFPFLVPINSLYLSGIH